MLTVLATGACLLHFLNSLNPKGYAPSARDAPDSTGATGADLVDAADLDDLGGIGTGTGRRLNQRALTGTEGRTAKEMW